MSSSEGADMGAMFLWWLTPTVQKDLFEREEREETERQERLEIQESERAMMQSFSKPSKVSKARYNQWLVSEEKRFQGEEGRAETDYHKQRSMASAVSFASAIHERTQMSHAERQEAAERVRMLKAGIAAKGQEARRQAEQARAKSGELKEEWRSLGSQNRMTHGVEQRQRVLESRKQKREANHSDAYEYKQRIADQAAEQAAREERALEEKRATVARIRAETATQCVQSAKEFYYSGRKQTADAVRADVSEWADEKQRNFNHALARARANKAAAVSSQEAAADGRADLELINRQTAEDMKVSLQAVRERREHLKSVDALKKRRAYEDAINAQFVTKAEARMVEESSLSQMANAHRDELASREGKPGRIIGKKDWRAYVFGGTGWFTNWFAPVTTSTVDA